MAKVVPTTYTVTSVFFLKSFQSSLLPMTKSSKMTFRLTMTAQHSMLAFKSSGPYHTLSRLTLIHVMRTMDMEPATIGPPSAASSWLSMLGDECMAPKKILESPFIEIFSTRTALVRGSPGGFLQCLLHGHSDDH